MYALLENISGSWSSFALIESMSNSEVHTSCILVFTVIYSRAQEDNNGGGEATTILQPSLSSNMFDELTKYIDDNIRVFRVSIEYV